jgi:hypothetical protein
MYWAQSQKHTLQGEASSSGPDSILAAPSM